MAHAHFLTDDHLEIFVKVLIDEAMKLIGEDLKPPDRMHVQRLGDPQVKHNAWPSQEATKIQLGFKS